MFCLFGIYMVGYIMIVYGVFGGFSFWISGILCEYVGRVVFILVGRFCLKKKIKKLCIFIFSRVKLMFFCF